MQATRSPLSARPPAAHRKVQQASVDDAQRKIRRDARSGGPKAGPRRERDGVLSADRLPFVTGTSSPQTRYPQPYTAIIRRVERTTLTCGRASPRQTCRHAGPSEISAARERFFSPRLRSLGGGRSKTNGGVGLAWDTVSLSLCLDLKSVSTSGQRSDWPIWVWVDLSVWRFRREQSGGMAEWFDQPLVSIERMRCGPGIDSVCRHSGKCGTG